MSENGVTILLPFLQLRMQELHFFFVVLDYVSILFFQKFDQIISFLLMRNRLGIETLFQNSILFPLLFETKLEGSYFLLGALLEGPLF